MRGYKIIKEAKGYRFVLIPNNNNNQPIGQSSLYKNERECRKGLADFAFFVKSECLKGEMPDKLVIKKNENNGYYYEYIIDPKIVFYRPYAYSGNSAKENCKKVIRGIYKGIDDYTTVEKLDHYVK